MKYLFIDTETTGLPLDDSFSIDAINNWPRLVSVAYILCDDRKIVRENYSIIKPNGFIIPPESTKVHGITSAEAISKGRALSEVLDEKNHGVGSTDHFSALKIWMFENKFVSLLSHLKTIEPMEVHRESRTMCNTETSKVISRTDPVMD